MTQPNFSTLPTVPSPERLSDSLNRQREAVAAERAAIETKRAAVVASLERARSADLASFKPTKFELLPLLQAEYQFRRSLADFIRKVLEESRAHQNLCVGDVTFAEDAVKESLVSIGYSEPVGGVAARGCFGPDWIARHSLVLAAKDKVNDVGGFIDGHVQIMSVNQQEVATLTKRLESLRDAAILAV